MDRLCVHRSIQTLRPITAPPHLAPRRDVDQPERVRLLDVRPCARARILPRIPDHPRSHGIQVYVGQCRDQVVAVEAAREEAVLATDVRYTRTAD